MFGKVERMGWLMVAICVWLGVCMAALGVIPTLAPAAVTMAIAGVGTGVINTFGISWLQRRTDSAMQGRVMSLVMLASVGLVPIAYALSGVIAQVNPTLLFVGAGALMLTAGAAAAASRTMRSI
jgi:hypothetical protein